MLRTIAGVIIGYIVMGVCVFVAMYAAYNALGEEWAFQDGVYNVSLGWAGLMLASGLVAAIIGGAVCGLISGRSRRAIMALAVVIVLLGALDAAWRLTSDGPSNAELARNEETPVLEAAGKAQPPVWVTLGNPVVGVIGVLIGGGIVGAKRGRNRNDS